MKQNNNLKLIVLFIIIGLTSSCFKQIPNTVNNSTNQLLLSNNIVKKLSKITPVKGKAEFPKLRFQIKATQKDVATVSTVSIIYPPDHPTTPNKTIATGLSDDSGSFSINSESNFNPVIGDVFVLEAQKRIGGVGNYIMTIRTYIKWNGTDWDSMTFPALNINIKTTALAIMAAKDPSVSANATIKTIDVSSGSSVPIDFGTIKGQDVNDLSVLVTSVLQSYKDPFSAIKLIGEKYELENTADLLKLIQTNNCSGCDLTSMDLTNVPMNNKILTGANLTGLNLTGKNLSGTNLVGANLNSTILSGVNFAGASLDNIDLSNSFAEKVVFSAINLHSMTHAKLINTYMSGSNLSGLNLTFAQLDSVDLSNANVSNSDLSNATGNNVYAATTGAGLTTNFSGAIFNSAVLPLFNVSGGSILNGANFTSADFSGGDFSLASLLNTKFYKSTLKNMKFIGSNINGANFGDGVGSSIGGATLDSSDFSGVNIGGAVFFGSSGLNIPGFNLGSFSGSGDTFPNSDIIDPSKVIASNTTPTLNSGDKAELVLTNTVNISDISITAGGVQATVLSVLNNKVEFQIPTGISSGSNSLIVNYSGGPNFTITILVT